METDIYFGSWSKTINLLKFRLVTVSTTKKQNFKFHIPNVLFKNINWVHRYNPLIFVGLINGLKNICFKNNENGRIKNVFHILTIHLSESRWKINSIFDVLFSIFFLQRFGAYSTLSTLLKWNNELTISKKKNTKIIKIYGSCYHGHNKPNVFIPNNPKTEYFVELKRLKTKAVKIAK